MRPVHWHRERAPECWVKEGNDAATAEQVCEGLSHMDTLPGHHKTFVLQQTAADLEKNLPVKGGKGSNAKHFTLYHEIDHAKHFTLCWRAVPVWSKQVFSCRHALTVEAGTPVWKGAVAHKEDLGAKNNSV